MARSIEERIEDWAKGYFAQGSYFTKTASINPEIDEALKKAPSKVMPWARERLTANG